PTTVQFVIHLQAVHGDIPTTVRIHLASPPDRHREPRHDVTPLTLRQLRVPSYAAHRAATAAATRASFSTSARSAVTLPPCVTAASCSSSACPTGIGTASNTPRSSRGRNCNTRAASPAPCTRCGACKPLERVYSAGNSSCPHPSTGTPSVSN